MLEERALAGYDAAEIVHGEQPGSVCIVHAESVAVAVHLVSPDAAVIGCVCLGELRERSGDFICQGRAFVSERSIVGYLVHHGRELAQAHDSKEICRDEKRVDARVV